MSEFRFSMEQADDDPVVSHSWDDDKQQRQIDDDPKTSEDWDKDKGQGQAQGDKK